MRRAFKANTLNIDASAPSKGCKAVPPACRGGIAAGDSSRRSHMGDMAIDAIAATAPKLIAIWRHGDALTQLRVLDKEKGQSMP